MKLKSLLFVCCLGLLTSVFADNRHFHPQVNNPNAKVATVAKSVAKGAQFPGYCQIEIINNLYRYIRVFGEFDDHTSMEPFTIYRYDTPHTIDLYYYGYCHAGMTLYIYSWTGERLYNYYTSVHSTIDFSPYLAKQAKVEVRTK